METLQYGYKKPEDGDTGDIFCPALADNVDLIVAHSHDGINSKTISTAGITKPDKIIAGSGAWSAVSGKGLYQQTITLGSATYENTRFECRIGSGSTGAGNIIFPTIEYVSGSSFTIIVNDNSINVDVYLV